MMIEMLIIAIIVIYIFIVNGKIDTNGVFTNNDKFCNLIKEKLALEYKIKNILTGLKKLEIVMILL